MAECCSGEPLGPPSAFGALGAFGETILKGESAKAFITSQKDKGQNTFFSSKHWPDQRL